MSGMRKVEFTEEPYADIGGTKYYPGDRKSLPKQEADQYIALGWAKCVDTGEQGERKPGMQLLEVQELTQQL